MFISGTSIYLCIGWNCSIIHRGSNQPSQQPVSPCQQPGDHAAAAFLAKRRWESGAGETEARRSYEGRSFGKVVTGRPTPNVPPSEERVVFQAIEQWLIRLQVGLISGGYGGGLVAKPLSWGLLGEVLDFSAGSGWFLLDVLRFKGNQCDGIVFLKGGWVYTYPKTKR